MSAAKILLISFQRYLQSSQFGKEWGHVINSTTATMAVSCDIQHLDHDPGDGTGFLSSSQWHQSIIAGFPS